MLYGVFLIFTYKSEELLAYYPLRAVYAAVCSLENVQYNFSMYMHMLYIRLWMVVQFVKNGPGCILLPG